MNTLAIDIGGTKFTIGAFHGAQLVLRETQFTDREGGPQWLVSQIEKIVKNWRLSAGFKPNRCGIGFGGPVDFPSQSVTLSTHVDGWESYPLINNIRQLTGVPTVIDNDANVGALGEAVYGAGKNINSLLYLTLSTGIGGGIIFNGEIYHGADSFAGEIGHLNVDPNGPHCLCGSNGCLERMCCGLWLERDFGRPAKHLMEEEDFVERYVVHLARGLKAAIMILNPGLIVIGGGISKAGDRLFMPLRVELNRQLTAWSRARRTVVPAQLADDSVLFGALALTQRYL